MKWIVRFEELENAPVEVDADTRWEAVRKAAQALGMLRTFPMQFLFDNAKVKKPDTSDEAGRPRHVDEVDRKALLKKRREKFRKEFGSVVSGKCEVCDREAVLVEYKDGRKGRAVCEECRVLLSGKEVSTYFQGRLSFEMRRTYVRAVRKFGAALSKGEIGPAAFSSILSDEAQSAGLTTKNKTQGAAR